MDPRQRTRSLLSRAETTDTLRAAFVRGLAILLPLVVTLLVLSIVLSFIASVTSPLVTALIRIPGVESRVVVTAVTLAVFGVLVVGIGLGAEYGLGNGRVGAQFDAFMSELPGIGSLYNGFNEVSELLLDSDTDSFQEVKLVEYPKEGSYVVAFKTADTAEQIESAVDGGEMVTLFVPMAPNPVMGGFVVHTERDRVVDVDLTVEEGIRSVVTSGVAVGEESTVDRPDIDAGGVDGSRPTEGSSVHSDAGSIDAESRLNSGSDGTTSPNRNE